MKPRDNILSEMELTFVAAHKGNDTEAARIAGYKHPSVAACRLMKRPRIQKALAEKNAALTKELGRSEGRMLSKVRITRNEIINILADVGIKGKSESARVAAASKLADIFRLSARNAHDNDPFTGWTEEELLHYARTGTYPARFRSELGKSGSNEQVPPSPTDKPN